VHRDFKPEDILLGADVLDAYLADAGFAKKDILLEKDILLGADVLDAYLTDAYLADAGFAKEDAGPEASKMKSASNSLGLTLGYLDPRVSANGAY